MKTKRGVFEREAVQIGSLERKEENGERGGETNWVIYGRWELELGESKACTVTMKGEEEKEAETIEQCLAIL